MRSRRTTSRGQARSSRAAGVSGSPSPWDEGNDYPVDSIAPDDLPERDIREDQEVWPSPDGAESDSFGEQSDASVDAAGVHRGSLEVRGIPSQDPNPHTVHEDTLTPKAPLPEQPVEAASAEPSAQYLLPGLEPDVTSDEDHPPHRIKRSRRPRAPSDKVALRAAQIELWPQTDSSSAET
jgi:hypothetical protein